MGSIEEDIEIVKELLKGAKEYGQYNGNQYFYSIENIASDYTRQKQINEEHKNINAELREKVKELEKENGDWIKAYQEEKDKQFDILRNSIPKQIIIEKIEEYYKKMEEDKGKVNWIITDRIVMNVLEELLQESEDK